MSKITDSIQENLKSIVCCVLLCFIFFTTFLSPAFCSSIVRQAVHENGLEATYYYKKESTDQPAIILFGGSSGGNFFDAYPNHLEDLVDNGYAVLSLAYFDYNSNGELPNMLHHIPIEYFKKAMDWMESQPQTAKGQFAVIGNSRGAEAALLLAIHYPEISTVIALVPSAYVGSAYNREGKVTGSAWTHNGKEIPYVDYQKALANYSPWWKIIEKRNEVEPFAIPVEKMSAALLLLSGKKDANWPSTEMSKRMIRRLELHRYTFPYQHISYEAGHNIILESFSDILQFLKKHHPSL